MDYLFRVDKERFYYKNNVLTEDISDDFCVFSRNFSKDEINTLKEDYKNRRLLNSLDECDKNNYLLFFYCVVDRVLYIFNDKFASNEILFYKSDGELLISNDVKAIFKDKKLTPDIDYNRVYEFLSFHCIVPPRTIYKNIQSVPILSYLKFNALSNQLELKEYCDISKLFKPKENHYDKLIESIRVALTNSFLQESMEDTAVSLSGGVDSGGLLGLLTKLYNKQFTSITVGPYGKNSGDLKSSRKTVKFNKSINYEIYLQAEDLKKLKKYLNNLSQPMAGHLVLAYFPIFDKAADIFAKKIVFGLGSEMLLGNLKICRLAYYLSKIESIIPFGILKIAYRAVAKFKHLSQNQTRFLLSESWADRFFCARGPLFVKEKKYFRLLNDDFLDFHRNKINKIFKLKNLNITDKIILVYLITWTNYLQMKELTIIGKKYKIMPVMPFNTPYVLTAIFKTSDKFRCLNKWNKQIIRDVFKPYITDQLYKNKGKSLIVPYNQWFKNNHSIAFKYLKSSKIVSQAINLESYQKDFLNLPEPGLSLMRLLSLALWYDLNWNKQNVENFDRMFSHLQEFNKKNGPDYLQTV